MGILRSAYSTSQISSGLRLERRWCYTLVGLKEECGNSVVAAVVVTSHFKFKTEKLNVRCRLKSPASGLVNSVITNFYPDFPTDMKIQRLTKGFQQEARLEFALNWKFRNSTHCTFWRISTVTKITRPVRQLGFNLTPTMNVQVTLIYALAPGLLTDK